jgi:hypothetical protein
VGLGSASGLGAWKLGACGLTGTAVDYWPNVCCHGSCSLPCGNGEQDMSKGRPPCSQLDSSPCTLSTFYASGPVSWVSHVVWGVLQWRGVADCLLPPRTRSSKLVWYRGAEGNTPPLLIVVLHPCKGTVIYWPMCGSRHYTTLPSAGCIASAYIAAQCGGHKFWDIMQ